MDKLRQILAPLRVFDAVSRTGSVSKAADILHVTPGAVSLQIKRLEESLAVELFRKEGRSIELTDAGRELAPRVADLFDRLENALRDVTQRGRSRGLRLKVMPSFAIRWLVPRLAGFYERYGHLDIEISTVARPDDTDLEDADFVVRHGNGNWADVTSELLFEDAFIPVCTAHLAKDITCAKDLLHANLLHSSMRPHAWATWFRSLGIDPPSSAKVVMLSNAALSIQAACDGLGVAMAQTAYLREELASGRLVPAVNHTLHLKEGYYLVCDPQKAELAPLKQFREWVRSL